MQGQTYKKARIYFAEMQASATYGGEVLGRSLTEIKALRQARTRALGFAGGSLDIGRSLYPDKDPLVRAVGTFKRYAKERWRA